MSKKKKEEKRIKRGLLSRDEHSKKREHLMLKSFRRNPKNNRRFPFGEEGKGESEL